MAEVNVSLSHSSAADAQSDRRSRIQVRGTSSALEQPLWVARESALAGCTGGRTEGRTEGRTGGYSGGRPAGSLQVRLSIRVRRRLLPGSGRAVLARATVSVPVLAHSPGADRCGSQSAAVRPSLRSKNPVHLPLRATAGCQLRLGESTHPPTLLRATAECLLRREESIHPLPALRAMAECPLRWEEPIHPSL
jgi:hypothetical protein